MFKVDLRSGGTIRAACGKVSPENAYASIAGHAVHTPLAAWHPVGGLTMSAGAR